MTEAAVRALLAAATTRGAIKRLGERADADPALRDALLALAPGADPDQAGKRLVRAALDRAAGAQIVSTPTRRDEAFTCAHCAAEVPPHGRTARDHCPRCLRSLHVDVIPGDRAAGCGGVMDPVGLEVRGDRFVLRFRCRRCAHERVNVAVTDGDVPDDAAALRALSTRGGPQ